MKLLSRKLHVATMIAMGVILWLKDCWSFCILEIYYEFRLYLTTILCLKLILLHLSTNLL